MKTPSAIIVLGLLVSAASAAENSQAKAVPQPRVRLDPVLRIAVVLPETKDAASVPVIVMEKFVVKEQNAIPMGPSHPAEYKGRFSALNGGHVLKGDVSNAQWEIGAWPWLPWTDVLSEDIMKFPKPKTRVDIDIVRIHWP